MICCCTVIASFDPRLMRLSSTDWSGRQRIRRGGFMTKKQCGDYQFDIYFDGLEGQTPNYPVDYAALERAAAEVLPPWVLPCGAGGESTQRANIEAFSRYGIMPRMLVVASALDPSVSLFDMQLPAPLVMC